MLYNYLCNLQAHSDFPATLRSLTAVTSALLSCTKVCIYVHVRRNRQLASRHTEGMNDFVLPQHCGVPGQVLYSGQEVQLDDPSISEIWSPEADLRTGFKTRSVLCVPVHVPASDHTVGVVEALNKRVGRFTDDDRKVIKVISSLAGIVLRGWRSTEMQRLREKQTEAQRALSFTISSLSSLPAITKKLQVLKEPQLLNCSEFHVRRSLLPHPSISSFHFAGFPPYTACSLLDSGFPYAPTALSPLDVHTPAPLSRRNRNTRASIPSPCPVLPR